ncbi:MAG: hypothetical protein AAF458_07015 [Pseudomonadota bacterium]
MNRRNKAPDLQDPEVLRRKLVQALGLGLFGIGAGIPASLAQQSVPSPGPLPAGRSIYRLVGEATVNGTRATPETRINAGDEVETRRGAEVVFAVNGDAFLLRENSRIQLERENAIIGALRMFTGALLGVFDRRRQPLSLSSSVATIGIRGTGVYMEADPERTYICTCYGETELAANDDQTSRETIVSTQHDAPRYILAAGAAGTRIQPAPFINHTDEELVLIEALVGRDPPFAVFGEGYDAPRPRY